MRRKLVAFGRQYAKPLFFSGALLGVILLFVVATHLIGFAWQTGAPQTYPEVAQLDAEQLSFQQYQTYFQQLAQKKGALYAYQVMLRAQFPQGIDLHLLGHVVGDVLYQQKGINGIQYCTQDFRNACSHSVVIGALLEYGPSAFPQIAEACKKAPGGPGAYTMCFHGLGHGVLAYTDYDLQKAVTMCKEVGTPAYHDQEYVECVGGTIMEMIAGAHDPVAWKKQVGNYFKTNDPLYPCDASWMPQEPRSMCYVYLTPHLFTAGGGSLDNPVPGFPKAFTYCDALSKDQPEPPGQQTDRWYCYNGFGKEFVVLAQGRDIRNVGDMQTPQLTKVRDWCSLAHDAEGEAACDTSALSSLFWGGENKPDASFLYCSLLTGDRQSSCYTTLAHSIAFYDAQNVQSASVCARLPAAYQNVCSAAPV